MTKFFQRNQREVLSLLLLLAFFASLFAVPWSEGVTNEGGAEMAQRMITSLFHLDLSTATLYRAVTSLWTTFTYAFIAVSIGVLFALILGLLASGVLFRSKVVRVLGRGIIGFLRAIHELVWAWMFVTAIGLNPLAGIFALSIPYSGYLGKIFADLFEEVPSAPLTALRASGANRLQVFLYGYLPIAFPNMLSYTMYRLECAIRSSSVLSFIGLGGIGFQIQTALQDMRFEEVWTYLFFLIALIYLIDLWSAGVRRHMAA